MVKKLAFLAIEQMQCAVKTAALTYPSLILEQSPLSIQKNRLQNTRSESKLMTRSTRNFFLKIYICSRVVDFAIELSGCECCC